MKFNPKHRVALFGTSADPPTNGHEKILEELSKIYSFTISYASNNPQKNHKEDITNRSLLLKTLIDELSNPRIIFNQKISSKWAVESIRKCKYIYNLRNLDFVIGSDLIAEIPSWRSFDKITKEVNFFIIKRSGYPIESNTLEVFKANKVNFEISNLTIPNVSSSMIRLNTDYSKLPKSLIDIVKKNNLYIPLN